MKKNIKNKSNTLNNKKIIKPIELKVKNNRKFNIKDIFKSSNGLIIFLIVVLLIMSICLIISIVKVQKNKPTVINNFSQVLNENNGLFSTWISTNDEILSFNSDLSFDYVINDIESYKGEFSYNRGLDALKDMEYSLDEFIATFGSEVNYDDVYSLKLLPTKSYKDKEIKNTEWWFIIIVNDDNAIAYNKTLDIRYSLTKKNI